MARTTATNFTGVNQFPKADAATDLFKKEDVQVLALAVDAHDHTAGKGLPMVAGSIPNGTITSAMIADATIDTADLKDGSVTSAKIADGTIATVDLANAAVTNAKLGSDTARDNLLTNGGFEIWQRGTSFSSITTDTFHADNWHTSPGVGSSFTTVQRTPTAGFTDGSPFSYGATYAHSAASNVFQKIEGFGSLVGRTVSLSVRVRTATANAVRLFLNDSVAGYNSSYHSGNDTWQTLTLTATIASNATSIVLGINLTASVTFYVDNAMLVVGSVPADYAPLHPADDLARCLRYYYILGSIPSGMPITVGQVGTTTAAFYALQTPASFAVTPTLTISSATHFQTWSASTAGLALASGPTLSNFAPPGLVYLAATVASGLVAGNASALISANPLAKMAFEANP